MTDPFTESTKGIVPIVALRMLPISKCMALLAPSRVLLPENPFENLPLQWELMIRVTLHVPMKHNSQLTEYDSSDAWQTRTQLYFTAIFSDVGKLVWQELKINDRANKSTFLSVWVHMTLGWYSDVGPRARNCVNIACNTQHIEPYFHVELMNDLV